MNEFTMNLQLFADGENIEDNANLAPDAAETENVEIDGDTQPEVDATPEEQSTNKDNPANHAFAEMRRKLKEQEQQIQSFLSKQKETDEYYANLAKSKGRNDIKTADEYFKVVRAEELAAQYQETQDPLKLAALIKEMIMPEIKQQPKQESYVDNGLDKELEEFNKTFKQNLKSVDEITTLSNNEEILQYMMNGIPLHKAYAAANPDKIAAAAKQAAINQAKGHNHVNANSNGGTVDTISVTASEIAQWKRRHGTDKTDDQCRKELIEVKKLMID